MSHKSNKSAISTASRKSQAFKFKSGQNDMNNQDIISEESDSDTPEHQKIDTMLNDLFMKTFMKQIE